MEDFPYFYTFSVLAHFIPVYILSAVNKAAFDQTHKMMKKCSSQRSIQRNRERKKNRK